MVALAVLVAVGVPIATAAPASILAAEEDFVFVGSPFEQPRGEVATLTNPAGSGAPHNVYATGKGPDGRELFFSESILPGNVTPVRGTQYLQAGSYPFVCTFHPGMDGILEVNSSGTAAPRPALKASIPSQGLRTVLRKGQVRVGLSTSTGVTGARVVVKVGRKTIASLGSLDLPAGVRRSVAAKILPQGKGVLKGKRSVTLAATASVEFGKPSTSRKVLR